jgi:hypothetical protein
MKGAERNIYLSFFYGQHRWHHCLRYLIGPVLAAPELASIIYFSNQRGDQIGLTLLKVKDVPATLARINQRATAFFSEHPSRRKEVRKGAYNIFRDFPNNQLRINLHHFPYGILPGHGLHFDQLQELSEAISSAMLAVFSSEPADDNARLIFSFYLYSLMIKSLGVTQQLASCGRYGDNGVVKQELDFFCEILSEIYAGGQNQFFSGQRWMSSWQYKCAQINADHRLATDLIFAQLGLNEEVKATITNLFGLCIKQIS